MSNDDWQHEVERYLAHFARGSKRPTILFTQGAPAAAGWTPALDMYETDDTFVIVLDLAGVDPHSTSVHTEAYALTVRGMRRERRTHADERPRTYHALEIPYGRFERTVRLPAGLDTDAAQANYRDGLLEITVPKRAPHQVRIAVQDPSASAKDA